MHMIGTNLSVWLNVLIQETKHEILTFYNPENNTIEFNKQNTPYQHSKSNHILEVYSVFFFLEICAMKKLHNFAV